MRFLDQVKIYVKSGGGGDGCVAFRREKFVEFGGPDGGNGGHGGAVVATAVKSLNTLIDFRYRQHFLAERGCDGMGADRSGRKGRDVVLEVPIGTQVLDERCKTVLADLAQLGQSVLLAQGGDGGFGNAYYKTATKRAPLQASLGWPGEERWLWLRLKLVADVGLVGLPNAGKSTFLSATTKAKPRIAAYPFTTLYPHLGVVYVNGGEFIVADVPGLIKGANIGTGLGIRFLGHVERCSVLLHLVDGSNDDVATAYSIVQSELDFYGHDLNKKIKIVALNKVDILSANLIAKRQVELAETAGIAVSEVRLISGKSGYGLDLLLWLLKEAIAKQRVYKASQERKAEEVEK